MSTSSPTAPDVVDLLTRQHREIRRGFRRSLLPGPHRDRAFAELRRLLAVHEAAEEAHVHPVARKAFSGGRAMVSSRLKEEKAAKRLLREAERTGPHTFGFARKLWRLRRSVETHARREEREEFPALLRAVTGPRRRMLGLESRLTQALAPTHPHPRVNSQLANKLAAPLAGPLDRGRDALRRLAAR